MVPVANLFIPGLRLDSSAFFFVFPHFTFLTRLHRLRTLCGPGFRESRPFTPVDREGSEWHHKFVWSLQTGGEVQ